MTVWRYGPSKYGLTVDAINDGVRLSIRILGTVVGTVMMAHDRTVDGAVQKSQKGQQMALILKWQFLVFPPRF